MINAIVVEDQVVVWDYIKSCLENYADIKQFCTSSKEAEEAFIKYKPDLVWLDCYLGEISEQNQDLKNSGLELAAWIKAINPACKVIMFTASNELLIKKRAEELNIDALMLGGKFIQDKSIVDNALSTIISGNTWSDPDLSTCENQDLQNLTIQEYAVITSFLIGKSTATIANELDTTRKMINNCFYRVRNKLKIDEDYSREEALEEIKFKLFSNHSPSSAKNICELSSIENISQNLLEPLFEKLKTKELSKVKFKNL
jgi:DNA-binding NarL/FixJ family response regulator